MMRLILFDNNKLYEKVATISSFNLKRHTVITVLKTKIIIYVRQKSKPYKVNNFTGTIIRFYFVIHLKTLLKNDTEVDIKMSCNFSKLSINRINDDNLLC